MLFSKIRQNGFIRVNSLKKINSKLNHPQVKEVSSDSFSSFQYSQNQVDPSQNIQRNKSNNNFLKQSKSKNIYIQQNHQPQKKSQTKKNNNSQLIIKKKSNEIVENKDNMLQTKSKMIQRKRETLQKKNKAILKQRNIQQQLKNVSKICDKISKMNLTTRIITNYNKKNIFEEQQQQMQPANLSQINNLNRIKKESIQQIQYKNKKKLSDQVNQNDNQHSKQFQNSSFKSQRSLNNNQVRYSPRQNLKQSIYVINQGKQYQEFPKNQIYKHFNLTQHQNQQQLVQNYDKVFFQKLKSSSKNQKFYQTQGGICFDINTKEFACKSKQIINAYAIKKKQSNLNSKDQILKRRQMAKIYDRQARFKIFGFS